jgi:hypothetical protein
MDAENSSLSRKLYVTSRCVWCQSRVRRGLRSVAKLDERCCELPTAKPQSMKHPPTNRVSLGVLVLLVAGAHLPNVP